MRSLRVLVVGLSSAMVAAAAPAQVVRGTVVAEESGEVVGQAVVQLLDSSGTRRLGVFSDDSGRFAIRAPESGRYILRAERVGFRPSGDIAVVLGIGETVERRLAMRLVPVMLDAVVTVGKDRCVSRDGSGIVADLWIAARASLQATTLAQDERMLRTTVERFDRLVRLNGKIISEQRQTLTSIGDNPFESAPADSLARHGYRLAGAADTTTYFAPDARVLLSDVFAQGHCFRLRLAGRAQRGMIGLAFEPVRLGPLLDVKGVLWLDQQTSVLRVLEFQYAGNDFDTPDDRFGGRMEFERLPNGASIVRRWVMRLPVYAIDRSSRSRSSTLRRPRPVVATGEMGGEVKEIALVDRP